MIRKQTRPRAVLVCAVLIAAVLLSACDDSGGAGNPTASPDAHHIQGQPLEQPLEKPQFILRDIDGNEFDFREQTAGYVTLLYFGYTHCPDICPSHMADVAAVLDRNPEMADHIKVVFVTVDPKRDTPDRLDLWLGLFSDDFIALTGTDEEIELATKAALKDMWFPVKTAQYGNDYSVSHAAFIIPYGHDGLAPFVWPTGTTQETYENDLKILTSQGEHSET